MRSASLQILHVSELVPNRKRSCFGINQLSLFSYMAFFVWLLLRAWLSVFFVCSSVSLFTTFCFDSEREF
jgi:hypothetical protein